jgi:hypothetical protein
MRRETTVIASSGKAPRYATVCKEYPDIVLIHAGTHSKYGKIVATCSSPLQPVGPTIYIEQDADTEEHVWCFQEFAEFDIEMAYYSAYTLLVLLVKRN